jgi:hypothetical protein
MKCIILYIMGLEAFGSQRPLVLDHREVQVIPREVVEHFAPRHAHRAIYPCHPIGRRTDVYREELSYPLFRRQLVSGLFNEEAKTRTNRVRTSLSSKSLATFSTSSLCFVSSSVVRSCAKLRCRVTEIYRCRVKIRRT